MRTKKKKKKKSRRGSEHGVDKHITRTLSVSKSDSPSPSLSSSPSPSPSPSDSGSESDSESKSQQPRKKRKTEKPSKKTKTPVITLTRAALLRQNNITKEKRELTKEELDEQNKVADLDIDKAFRKHMTESPLGPMKGKGRSGDKHRVRLPRDRSSDRQLQALTQLSFILFAVLKRRNKSEQEIQVMDFNGNLVITANEGLSIDELEEILSEALDKESFINAVLDVMPDQITGVPAGMLERKAIKLHDATVEDSSRSDYLTDSLVERLSGKLEGRVLKVDMNTIVAELKKNAGKILLLTPGKYHAEQNFALILAKNPDLAALGPPIIAGKKRPCATCFLTLKLLTQGFLIPADFIKRGGHYFTPANLGLKELIEVGIEQGRFTRKEINEWLEQQIKEQDSHTSKRHKYTKTNPSDKGDSGINSESESEAEDEATENYKKRKRGEDDED